MATTPDIAFERGLPASVDAERSILGAILLDNHAYNEAAEKLQAADFALESHQRIFARIGELMDASRAVDIVTLAEELARLGDSSREPRTPPSISVPADPAAERDELQNVMT